MSEIKIVIHVKGLNNARMPALVDLRNLSVSYMVNTDKNSTDLATNQFLMNNRIYDPGSNTQGRISASFNVFGVVGDRSSMVDQPLDSPVMLDILFMLVDADKTIVNKTIKIKQLIHFSTDNNGTVTLEVNIDLPNPLPEVIP